ncbi:metalloregulator ArsR/SmtB family transcription factor [bacterium]|nr:metalloregulator ArsR/SmtB family transcription factor [bacterium]
MEPTARLFRTLANNGRLRILRLLVVLKECRVGEIIEATGMLPTTVSTHLRILSVCGLIWKRRSGGAVYYRVADAPSNPLTQAVLSVLECTFRRVRERDPRLVAECDQVRSREHSDAALFALFTAFTHPRRLQIILHLSRNGPICLAALGEGLDMSRPAVWRHTAKLEHRGIIRNVGTEKVTVCELASEGRSLRSRVVRAVLASLGPKEE